MSDDSLTCFSVSTAYADDQLHDVDKGCFATILCNLIVKCEGFLFLFYGDLIELLLGDDQEDGYMMRKRTWMEQA